MPFLSERTGPSPRTPFPQGFHPAKEHIIASRRDSVTAIVAGTDVGDDRG
jgi:hypothetical protein